MSCKPVRLLDAAGALEKPRASCPLAFHFPGPLSSQQNLTFWCSCFKESIFVSGSKNNLDQVFQVQRIRAKQRRQMETSLLRPLSLCIRVQPLHDSKEQVSVLKLLCFYSRCKQRLSKLSLFCVCPLSLVLIAPPHGPVHTNPQVTSVWRSCFLCLATWHSLTPRNQLQF